MHAIVYIFTISFESEFIHTKKNPVGRIVSKHVDYFVTNIFPQCMPYATLKYIDEEGEF